MEPWRKGAIVALSIVGLIIAGICIAGVITGHFWWPGGTYEQQ